MPTNLYGPGDNYDLADAATCCPALMRKVHEAKAARRRARSRSGAPARRGASSCTSTTWPTPASISSNIPPSASALGAGRAPLVNVGCGEDLTIAELAALVREAVGSRAEIVYDRTKPDGTPRKLLDIALAALFGLAAAHRAGGGLAVDLRVFCQPVNDFFSSRRPLWGTWCINARP